mgnify:CR=1 FL=1
MNKLQITNDRGITFNARVNKNYADKDTITFYDSRYTKGFNKLGQSVATYCVSTLLGKDGFSFRVGIFLFLQGKGLNLYGGEEDWYLTEQNTIDVVDFLERNNYE